MQWEFTADQVVKGEIDYDIKAFRRDFFEEVSANMNGVLESPQLHACFDQLYDLTYWLATGRPLDSFPEQSPVDAVSLAAIAPSLAPNVEMLGAMLQRLIMDGVAEGLPLDAALAEAAEKHAAIVHESTVAFGSRPTTDDQRQRRNNEP